MKKLLIWLPGMLSMLAACTEAVEIPARAPEKQSPVRVELHLTTEQQAATRAMDENCILNLYLECHNNQKQQETSKRKYLIVKLF